MQAIHPSARYYSMPLMLRTYDFWVLYVTNNWIWRCRTRSVLLPLYQKHIGENAHLDVGVGTGYLPANAMARLAKTKSVMLLDLNPDTLRTSEARIRAAGYAGVIEKVNQSVFDPLPESLRGKFDSISTFYMLHYTWKSYSFFNTALRRSFFCVRYERVVDTSGSSMRYVLARSAAFSLPSARPLISESCNSFAMERRKS